MNKKITTCLLFGTLLTASSVFAHDDHQSYPSQFGSKLTQGFANMTTGFVEVPKNIVNITHEHNIFVGATWGLFRGIWEGVNRTTIGAAEFISIFRVKTFAFKANRFISNTKQMDNSSFYEERKWITDTAVIRFLRSNIILFGLRNIVFMF